MVEKEANFLGATVFSCKRSRYARTKSSITQYSLYSMQAGDWVLLDELNLASQSVLEGLLLCIWTVVTLLTWQG